MLVIPYLNGQTQLDLFSEKANRENQPLQSHTLFRKGANERWTSFNFWHAQAASTAFVTGCSVAESRLNAETWLDDRLESCKHISLLSQSPIFIYGISTRVGKQAVPTVLAWVVGRLAVTGKYF